MFLIYDTESSAFPNTKVSPTSKLQARVCQIAALKFDSAFNEVGELYTLIKPDSKEWKMSVGASKVNGITDEMVLNRGIEHKLVIEYLLMLGKDCKYTVCHNSTFDNTMLGIEFANYDGAVNPFILSLKNFCTMKLTTDVLKLPHKNPKKSFGAKYKWPKLNEAYEYFFKEPLINAHDALNDVRATAKIFKKLLDSGIVKLPI